MDASTAAGWVLVLAAVTFFGVGFGLAAANRDLASAGTAPTAERLGIVSTNRMAWRGVVSAFIVAFAASAAGVGLLAEVAGRAGQGVLATLAFTLYVLAVAVFLCSLAFQIGIIRHLKEDPEGVAPAALMPLHWWAESMYQVFMVLAYAAIALLGWAVLAGSILPSWAGWVSGAMGVLGLGTFVVGRPKLGDLVVSDLPLWLHVWALIVGVTLLVG